MRDFGSQLKALGLYDFAGTEKEELLRRTAEQVVALKIHDERLRTSRTEPEPEQEVRVRYRTISSALRTAITATAHVCNCSDRLVVKCLVHKGVALLSEMEDLVRLNRQYRDIIRAAGKYRGLSRVRDMVDVCLYELAVAQTSVSGEFCMADKLRSAYSEFASGIGIGVSNLVAVSLAMVFQDADMDFSGVSGDLRVEADTFRVYVRDRAILMNAYWEIVQAHIADAGPTTEYDDNHD